LSRDIYVTLTIGKQDVILECETINLFTYGSSRREVLKNFETLLVDYFEDLKKRRKTLSRPLREELEYLKSLIAVKE